MKRLVIAIACGISVAMLATSIEICSAQDFKFAFVDFQKFAGKSKRAQSQQQTFAQLVDTKRVALENKKKELETLNEQLQKQGPMLKEETRNQKIKELGIKEMEFKLAEKEAQNSLQNEQREQQEIFRRDISKIITQVRAQKNLTVIFDSAALLSGDDAYDITDEVVRVYDSENGSGAAKAKPATPAATPAPAKPKPAK